MSTTSVKMLQDSIDKFDKIKTVSFRDERIVHAELYVAVTNMLYASELVRASLVDDALLTRAMHQLRLFVCANDDLLHQHMSKIGAELKTLLDGDSGPKN